MKIATGFRARAGIMAVVGGAALIANNISKRESKSAIAQQVINVWAPIILRELELQHKDSILKKITVSKEVQSTGLHGQIAHQFKRTGFFSIGGSYVPDSAAITIFANNMNKLHVDTGVTWDNPLMFGKAFRVTTFFTLAHELRHFWQLETGAYHEKSTMINGVDIIPYKERWIEKDANAFAAKLVKKYKKLI